MATYQILYWKNIPAQVKVYRGRRPISKPMPDRFQQEIDRVAMKEGLAGTDAYLEQWQWTEKKERDGEADALLDALLQELETEYDERQNEV